MIRNSNLSALSYALSVCAVALVFLVSCTTNKEDPVIYDDSYYASNAVISSSAAEYTQASDGGTIKFGSDGGTVDIEIDCGTQWIVENPATDLFPTSVSGSTLTVTAGLNKANTSISAVITLCTAADRIKFASINVTQSPYTVSELYIETNEWHFLAADDLTGEIAVTSSRGWDSESSAEWLVVSNTETGISFTAEENDDTEERSALITVFCDDGVTTISETIAVTQDAHAYITLSKNQFTFYDQTGTSRIAVESNYDWDYSYDSSEGWFTVSRSGDTLEVIAEAYDGGNPREGSITVVSSDGGGSNRVEINVPVVQYGSQPEALILEYTVGSSDTTIHIPLSGTVDCTVDWGDDSEIENVTSSAPSHVYSSAGIYTVRINGTVTALNCKSYADNNNVETVLTAVIQWGSTGLTDLSYAFYYNRALTSIPGNTGSSAFADVTAFDYAFQSCNALVSIPADLFAGASKAETFVQTFYLCKGLTSVPSGLFDDCTAATSFYATFNGCSVLETIPAGLFRNCTKVTTFNGTFYNCKVLTSIPTGFFDNCPDATDFSYTFGYCQAVTTIPDGLFDNNPAATLFYGTFYYCNAIEAIPNGLFDKNSKATDFTGVFYSCTTLTSIPEHLFDNCPAVTSFQQTFSGCSSITAIPEHLFDNCPEVLSFQSTFNNCSALTSIPKGIFDNNTKVTTFYATFYCCSKIEEIPSGLFDNCPEVLSFYFTFYEWKSLKAIPKGLFDKNTKVQIFRSVFYKCESLTDVPEDLFANCPDVYEFSFTFYQCKALTAIPAGIFDNNKKVTAFASTFYNCPSLACESPYTVVDGVKVHLYDRTAALGYTVPTDTSMCFLGCSNLTDYSNIPYSWIGK